MFVFAFPRCFARPLIFNCQRKQAQEGSVIKIVSKRLLGRCYLFSTLAVVNLYYWLGVKEINISIGSVDFLPWRWNNGRN